jgi:lipopolysaccharide/colanic/teichoic acid biosynthesis glycosyltransferase
MPPISVKIAKRFIDIAGSAVGLGLALPLLPVIAAAVRLDSPGPVFYSQIRARMLLPFDGTEPRCTVFTMFKFRTMRQDAEAETGAVLASEGDERVTAVGRFLRKTRLDELPQLWNVLRGDMSLVGPRPERPELFVNLARAIPFFEERMRDVKPGITGLAQISLGYTGRIPQDSELWAHKDALQNPFDLPDADGALADDVRAKLLYDLAYSAGLEDLGSFLATELRIIINTPLVMLRGLGQ